MADRDVEFGEYLDSRAVVMRRTAFLLCGGDWCRAEDLVQTTLTKICVAWPRIRRDGSIDAYSRKIMARAAIDEARRAYRRREAVVGEVPEIELPPAGVEDVVDVCRALAPLPAGQRAVVVLQWVSPGGRPVVFAPVGDTYALRSDVVSPSGKEGSQSVSVAKVTPAVVTCAPVHANAGCAVRTVHGMRVAVGTWTDRGTSVTATATNLPEAKRLKCGDPADRIPVVGDDTLAKIVALPGLRFPE